MFREHLSRAGLIYFSPHLNGSPDPIMTECHSGQPREFAFVEMASAGDADNAITEPNGTQLHGHIGGRGNGSEHLNSSPKEGCHVEMDSQR